MLKVKILYIKNEVFMKKYVAFFICLLLTVSFLSLIEAKGKEPVRSSTRWGDDVNILSLNCVILESLDADNSTGNLFCLIQSGFFEYIGGWSLFVSLDTGKTWTSTYNAWEFAMSSPNDMGGVVMGNYFYTVVDWYYGETIQRFSTSTGLFDSTYDTTAIVTDISVGEKKLASSQTYFIPRLYFYAKSGDSLLFYWSEDSGKTWIPDNPGIKNISGAFDVCGNEGGLSKETWCCYRCTNDSLYAASRSNSSWTYYGPFDYIVGDPSIDAYKDTVIIVYPSRVGEDNNYIKYVVSYNGGNDWVFGVLYGPSAVGIDKSDVTAGDGYGFGVVYVTEEEGFYTQKNPVDASWSEPISFSDTAGQVRNAEIVQIANGNYGIAYGVNYWPIADLEAALFDRSDWVSGIEEKSPGRILLSANPSLFTSRTSIEYTLPIQQNISLDVYDVLGNHIVTLASGEIPAGNYSAIWDGKDVSGNAVASGMYFCMLKANTTGSISTRITLIK